MFFLPGVQVFLWPSLISSKWIMLYCQPLGKWKHRSEKRGGFMEPAFERHQKVITVPFIKNEIPTWDEIWRKGIWCLYFLSEEKGRKPISPAQVQLNLGKRSLSNHFVHIPFHSAPPFPMLIIGIRPVRSSPKSPDFSKLYHYCWNPFISGR